jgi:Trypsin-like peptidase domain
VDFPTCIVRATARGDSPRSIPYAGLSPPFIVAVANRGGVVAGVGFLISSSIIVTCGHVVRDARSDEESEILVGLSGDEDGEPIEAKILEILGSEPEHQSRDVALLELPGEVQGFDPKHVKFVDQTDFTSMNLNVFGFPDNSTVIPRHMVGDNIDKLTATGYDARGLVQLRLNDKPVQRGFSGAPVRYGVDTLGMLVSSRSGGQEAFMIPTRLLTKRLEDAVPKLAIKVRQSGPARRQYTNEYLVGTSKALTTVV